MREVRLASEPAPGREANEDIAFVVGDLVGVLDGVTRTEGLDDGCCHGPAWYVQRLAAERLLDRGRRSEGRLGGRHRPGATPRYGPPFAALVLHGFDGVGRWSYAAPPPAGRRRWPRP